MDYSNRKILLKVNSITSLAYQLIVLVCGFILPRLIIEYYGSAVNGLIASITQFLGIISLCELGMGAVVPASLYKPLANKDNDAISKIVISSERFYRKIAVIMIVYVLGLISIYPKIVDEFSFVFTATLIIIIAASSFAQYFFGITYSLLITADQKQYVLYLLNGGTIILNLVLSYILIKFYFPIHIVKLVSSIVFISRPLILSLYVKRHYNINKRIVYNTEPIKQKWNGLAQHLAFAIQQKTGVVILSLMATLVDVSIFSVYFLILEGLRGLVYSVTSSLTSYLGNLIAKDEEDNLKNSFIKIEWALHSITVLFFACASILIIPFVSVYTLGIDDANYIVPVFPYLMCAAIGFRCLQMPYNIVVQAAGHFKETQNSAILEPIINIIISIVLVIKYGLNGVAIGMLVSLLYRMMYLSLYLTSHILHNSKHLLFKRLLIDALLVISIIFIKNMVTMVEVSYLSWTLLAIKVVCASLIITVIVNVVFYKKLTTDFFESTIRKRLIK